VTLGVQIVGLQYNDDLNVNFIPPATLASAGYDNVYPAGLAGFTSVDLNVAHNFTPNIQAFFGMQNMLNKTYFVQTNLPRRTAAGQRMRIRFAARKEETGRARRFARRKFFFAIPAVSAVSSFIGVSAGLLAGAAGTPVELTVRSPEQFVAGTRSA
jgi:hypothetical protein